MKHTCLDGMLVLNAEMGQLHAMSQWLQMKNTIDMSDGYQWALYDAVKERMTLFTYLS